MNVIAECTILGEAPFLQRKTFLRSFVKRVEVNPKKVVVDYTIPLPLETKRPSTREILYIDRIGSAYRICNQLCKVIISASKRCFPIITDKSILKLMNLAVSKD